MVKSYLNPTKCPCKMRRMAPYREFDHQVVSNLKKWAETTRRPDVLLHLACVAEGEKMNRCLSDLTHLLWPRDLGGVDEGIIGKAVDMQHYLGRQPWIYKPDFSAADEVFAEVERIKVAWALSLQGDDEAAKALWREGAFDLMAMD